MTMRNGIPDQPAEMDTETSLSICQAIGSRLRDDFQPAPSLPPHLQVLLTALARDDDRGSSTDQPS